MEKVYLALLQMLSGLPGANFINSSALPDKLFHPQYQPIILFFSRFHIHIFNFLFFIPLLCVCFFVFKYSLTI